MQRVEIEDLTKRFVDGWNSHDLDSVMSFFADDAIFEAADGKRSAGKVAIRDTFEPMFKGENGKMQFVAEDIIIDTEAGKVLAAWRLTLNSHGKSHSMRGLDILHFTHGKLTRKSVYAKTKQPEFQIE